MLNSPLFYFTVHPRDAQRTRLIPNCNIMLVASAHWNDNKKYFKVPPLPTEMISRICIDSGGFTAARKWGKYPWTIKQYIEFIIEINNLIPIDFCAIMDYACEPSVNREVFETNKSRIQATIQNEIRCKYLAPELPWLSVLQGDSLEERAFDLAIRKKEKMLSFDYAGIGSVCGRGPSGAKKAISFYRDSLADVKYHTFGLDIRAINDYLVFDSVKSWDSYAWFQARSLGQLDSPYGIRPGESHDDLRKRLMTWYRDEVIGSKLTSPKQGVLL